MNGTAAEAIDFVLHEAECLDRRRWDAWLELFAAECSFWAPSWLDEEDMGDDPTRQVSLIYYESREGLEDRVRRISSGRSLASTPLPRTMHAVTNLRTYDEGDAIRVTSNWSVDAYDLRTDAPTRLFGRYEHRLVGTGDGLRIAAKRIEVLSARLPSIIDIYLI